MRRESLALEDVKQVNGTRVLELGRTSGDTGNLEVGGTTRDATDLEPEFRGIFSFKQLTAVGVCVGLQSVPLNSTMTPTGTDDVAGSCTWSGILLGLGSRAKYGSGVGSGSVVHVGCCWWLGGVRVRSGAGIGITHEADGHGELLLASAHSTKARHEYPHQASMPWSAHRGQYSKTHRENHLDVRPKKLCGPRGHNPLGQGREVVLLVDLSFKSVLGLAFLSQSWVTEWRGERSTAYFF